VWKVNFSCSVSQSPSGGERPLPFHLRLLDLFVFDDSRFLLALSHEEESSVCQDEIPFAKGTGVSL